LIAAELQGIKPEEIKKKRNRGQQSGELQRELQTTWSTITSYILNGKSGFFCY